MRAFRRERGALVAELDATERGVFAAVIADVADLLGAGRLEERDPDEPATDPAAGMIGMSLRTQEIEPPEDDAVRRLLPDASVDDEEVAAEFRRLTEDDLRRVKVERLTWLWDALTSGPGDGWPADAVVVPLERGGAVAATLTDLRLVLADRLELHEDEDAESLYVELDVDPAEDEDDPQAEVRRYLGAVYISLSWLQETLMAALLDDLGRAGRDGQSRQRG
ncbi:DUF2017 domain-containing protein [Cellulomonas cellasea]|uniref:DUF2017 domain-containing protein n=1 Tax=Cellulomonas cellasea TaxID=43670 RepID=UPI0025A48300|nr:DUF2017 domain-containing protein [Cellulomonas cellasea]MDM8083694.1 DUF2017 domain-containing protein [Cellulomonas cellasea]